MRMQRQHWNIRLTPQTIYIQFHEQQRQYSYLHTTFAWARSPLGTRKGDRPIHARAQDDSRPSVRSCVRGGREEELLSCTRNPQHVPIECFQDCGLCANTEAHRLGMMTRDPPDKALVISGRKWTRRSVRSRMGPPAGDVLLVLLLIYGVRPHMPRKLLCTHTVP